MATVPLRPENPLARLGPALIVGVALLALAVAGGAIAAQLSSLNPTVNVSSGTPAGPGVVAAPNTVTVQGVGRVKVAPDTAIVSMGVTVTRNSPGEAMDAAAASLGKLTDAVKAKGVDASAISTQMVNVYPYTPYGSTPTGYTANETVSVRVADLSAASGVISAGAGAAGSDFVLNGIQMTRQDQASQLTAARKAALDAAAGQAGQLASGAGKKLGGLESMSELSSGYVPPGGGYPYGYGGLGGGQGASAPAVSIEPGLGEVVVVVSATYGLQSS